MKGNADGGDDNNNNSGGRKKKENMRFAMVKFVLFFFFFCLVRFRFVKVEVSALPSPPRFPGYCNTESS